MKHLFRFAAVILLVVSMTMVAGAQTTKINYGDIVTGEISDQTFEVEYTFDGTAGDVIVILMQPVDTLGDLDDPDVILLNSDGVIVADTSSNIEFAAATLTTQLPAEDIYTIIATRGDGRAGDSVGEYTLELILPEPIALETAVQSTVSSESRPQYFSVVSADPIIVNYQHIGGELLPQITINTLSVETPGGVDEIAVASGDALTLAALGVFDEQQPYVIAVERALFTFSFDEIFAEFEIGVQVAE